MNYEIELKAHVRAPEAVRAALEGNARFVHAFEKKDVYYYPPGPAPAAGEGLPASGVRVRREKTWRSGAAREATVVTYKTKEIRDGVELNEEREFAIAEGAAAFEELLARLALAPGSAKTKRGQAWHYEEAEPPITAELVEVSRGEVNLGYFLELEILFPASPGEVLPAQTAAVCRERLLALLRLCGLGEEAIEGRYYTEMLAAPPGRR